MNQPQGAGLRCAAPRFLVRLPGTRKRVHVRENLARSTEVEMGYSYPALFRDDACNRMLSGIRVEALARELGVPPAALYRWKRQTLIYAGRKPGIKSYEPDEPDELARARRRDRRT
jgi:hypothetical protein